MEKIKSSRCVKHIPTWNLKQHFFYWMLGETPIVHVKIWNHPIETTIYEWLFGVPGTDLQCF